MKALTTVAIVLAGLGFGCSSEDASSEDASSEDASFVTRAYLLTQLIPATSASEAAAVALDLDGDGMPENSLGSVYGAILRDGGCFGRSGSCFLEALAKAPGIDNPEIPDNLVFELGVKNPGQEGEAQIRSYFQGEKGETIAALQSLVPSAPDRLEITSELGQIFLPIGFAGEVEYVVKGPGTLRFQRDVQSGEVVDCAIAIALPPEMIAPIWHEATEQYLGGCLDCESAKASYLAFFDLDADGTVTLAEYSDNSIINAMLAADIDLYDADGVLLPNSDGLDDSMSFAMGCSLTETALVGATD